MAHQPHRADPVSALKKATVHDIKGSLWYRVESSRCNGRKGITKLSTMKTNWQSLAMQRTKFLGQCVEGDIQEDIKNWIKTDLKRDFDLDDTPGEKASISEADIHGLLYEHWVADRGVFQHERIRVGLPPFLQCLGNTSSRPGAMIEVKYENIEFRLYPPLEDGDPAVIVLVLNLTNIKRSAGMVIP
jgi:hypothetical protein